MNNQVKRILIVGGGTAGWMAAAALSARYRKFMLDICLVESEEIGSVGVGEATVPGIRRFHHQLAISERDFVRETQASFKLGIEFQNWRQSGHRFFHPFSAFGAKIADQDFYQCWLKLWREGYQFPLESYSLAVAMARSGRFSQPDESSENPLAWYNYAYHFDASLYAKFLRKYAEDRGVKRVQGKVVEVQQDSHTGELTGVCMDSGERLTADLFVDCSGFRALLIEQTLESGFEDWSHWLPCDSAVVVQTKALDDPIPYTISLARDAGWQWRIPLQHRKGNGYVYSSRFVDHDAAHTDMLKELDGPMLTEPKFIRFTTGIRHRFWEKNCIALGLASGFIEPLESTSISLIQTGIDKLIQFLPDLLVTNENVAEANRLNRLEYERIRDFIVLHYISSSRRDTPFWRYVSEMEIPYSLREKIEAFRRDGEIVLFEQESFQEASWLSMYNGFGIFPRDIKPQLNFIPSKSIMEIMEKMRRAISRSSEYASTHSEFLASM